MKEELQDLVTSKGWLHVRQCLEKRRTGFVNELLGHSDHQQLLKFQAAVREIDYLLKLPHELITEE